MSTSPHFRHIAPGTHLHAYRLNPSSRSADFVIRQRDKLVRVRAPSWKFHALWSNDPSMLQLVYRAYHLWRLNRRLARMG